MTVSVKMTSNERYSTDRKHRGLARERALEQGTLLRNLRKGAQADELKSATIREQVSFPSLELVCSSCSVENADAWAQVEVICVVEDERDA